MINSLEGSDFQGYFSSEGHFQICQQLASLTLLGVDVTTPYEFSEIALKKPYRKAVNEVINLMLTMVEVSNITAEEIFLGGCLYVSEIHLHANLSDTMQEKF